MKRKKHSGLGSFVECLPVWACIMSVMLFSTSVSAMDTAVGGMHIFSSTEYRIQWSNSPDKEMVRNETSDQDFYQLIGLDWDIADSGFTFNFMGKWSKDLDGTREGSIFQDYYDFQSGRQLFNPYYAYIEKRNLMPNLDVRLGRQYAYGAETVQFDGAWLRSDRQFLDWLAVEAYGGIQAQTYSNLNRDGIAGANIELYPVKNLIVHLDGTFYKENSLEFYADWKPIEWLTADAHWGLINLRNRFMSVNLQGDWRKTGTTLQLSFLTHFKNNTVQDFMFDYQSPFVDLGKDIKNFYLQREQGYYDSHISLTQAVPGIHGVTCFFRYGRRDLMDDSGENLYNTDYHSITAGMNLDEILGIDGFHYTFGFSKWWENRNEFSNGRKLYEATSLSWFMDIRQRLFEKFEIAGGFYFKDEDVNAMIEGEAAHHYYASVKYEVLHASWAELKYEYERDDYYKEFGISDINSLTASFNVRF